MGDHPGASAFVVGGYLAEVLLELVGCQLALGVAGEHCPDAQVRVQDQAAVWTTLLDHVFA